MEKFLKIIFPPKCVLCGKKVNEANTLCNKCWNEVKPIQKPFCSKCSSPLEIDVDENHICLACMKNKPNYIKLRSAFAYNDAVAKIVSKFKFSDAVYLRSFMAKNILRAGVDIIDDINIFIPVPLHLKRLRERKYNQSLLLCNELAKMTNKKVIADFLLKTKHTLPQVGLSETERETNLKNKFFVNQSYVLADYKNFNFAIVDDVVTTGSTINECIKTLNDFGIKNVYALSFAKTTFKKF
jgi:ComF family protein